jgi:hypothetical protein
MKDLRDLKDLTIHDVRGSAASRCRANLEEISQSNQRRSQFWTSFLSNCVSQELKGHSFLVCSLSSLLTQVLRKEVQNWDLLQRSQGHVLALA